MMKKTIAILAALLLLVWGTNQVSAQRKKTKKTRQSVTKKNPPQPMKEPLLNQPTANQPFKILAEGENGKFEQPFVFVARNAETYAALQKINAQLPANIDFTKTAVVAVFAGEQPNPGFGVALTQNADKLQIGITQPKPDLMYSQIIVYPYKIAAVPVAEERGVRLEIGQTWLQSAQNFALQSGSFEMSGGFIATQQKFDLTGTIKIWRYQNLVTALFDLKGNGARQITETASGTITNNGEINFSRVDAGTLIDLPRPPLIVKGVLADNKLTLNFTTQITNLADGFGGTGSVEATVISNK